MSEVSKQEWEDFQTSVVECRQCQRLVEHREHMAREKRAAFRNEEYWGRPVPGFGDRQAMLLIVGLAPAAHGANRTGRMFTGDRSGDWLYRALYRAGFANQPKSIDRCDGLELTGTYISAAVRCAPPDNRPTTIERDACQPFLERDIEFLESGGLGIRVIVPLGQFAYNEVLRIYKDQGYLVPKPKPRFGHSVEVPLKVADTGTGPIVIASFHPSQQNTFTGKLTEEMLDAVFKRARILIEDGSS